MTPKLQRALVTSLIVLGVMFVGFFGLRTLRAFKEVRGHKPPRPPFAPGAAQQVETDVELIRDWMTIGFISHSYNTHPKMLYEALGIPPKGNEEKSLKQLNEEYFAENPGYVLDTVKATILAALPPTAIPPISTNTPHSP
jgi:hypothetical protein